MLISVFWGFQKTFLLSNRDIIKFSFNSQDLPHLLGLQYLVDNPYLFEYSEKI